MEFRSKLEEIADSRNNSESHNSPPTNSGQQLTEDYIQKEFPSAYRAIKDAGNSYLEKVKRARLDFQNNVPWKDVFTLRREQMGGLLGYTYLNSRMLVKQEPIDLQGMDREVLLHELIHTDWEYQTRILARWMLSHKETRNYIERNAKEMYGEDKHMDN